MAQASASTFMWGGGFAKPNQEPLEKSGGISSYEHPSSLTKIPSLSSTNAPKAIHTFPVLATVLGIFASQLCAKPMTP